METKYFYINTIGCQMNVYDSEKMASVFTKLGYQRTDTMETADLVVVNTCSIREKAEQKAFSFLGRLAVIKRKRKDLIIGIGGCVAQQEGKKILKRMPYVDLVFGTRAIQRLPMIIERVQNNREKIVDIEMPEVVTEIMSSMDKPITDSKGISKFVTIMRGCDNFCSYCVVPYVRGREISRLPEDIISEIEVLVNNGVHEVTLLGQNVNSYGMKEGLCSFSELLRKVSAISGLKRLRFTTSHPKDLSDELIYAMNDLEKVCDHIHLPVQSGSNAVLKRMNRKYTREDYIQRIETLRKHCPDIAISSDFIVGFPGETDEDFNDTLSLIKSIGYDGIFAFSYSDRPSAPALHFKDKVEDDIKKQRLQILLDAQDQVNKQKNLPYIGKHVSVLVEGRSKMDRNTTTDQKDGLQWTGRTSTNKIVNFVSTDSLTLMQANFIGRIVSVRIDKAFPHSLWGEHVTFETQPLELKGDKTYAA